ncbi:MAG TPA: hypothetical protein VID29_01280 [Solirubrobacteraceae bacterium]
MLIAAQSLEAAGPRPEPLAALRTAETIGEGIRAGDGSLVVDACAIEALPSDFDLRMHRSRAIVLAARTLDGKTLLKRGAVFEIATRARQGGVPAYAIVGHNALDLFEARILDLQAVLQAGDRQGVTTANAARAAGRGLAGLI